MFFDLVWIIFLGVLISQETKVNGVDYCKLSCNGQMNIACNNNGTFGPLCASTPQLIPISHKLQTAILLQHNRLRNSLASGSFAGFKPAVRMSTLLWDDELSEMAALNVKQCVLKQDQCRATERFPYAGQNLAIRSVKGNLESVQRIAVEQVRKWFEEYRVSPKDIIDKFNAAIKGVVYQHFTQMAQEEAMRVGCSIIRQTRGAWSSQLMACNYGFSNVLNRIVYQRGLIAGSQCVSGKNPRFRNLCSIKEVYEVTTI